MADKTMDKIADKPYVVGVDLGGTNVRAAVIDRTSEQIVARGENISSRGMDGPELTAMQIATAARTALDQAGADLAQVLGVGVAVPGHVKAKEGLVKWAPNFKDQWKDVPIAALIEPAIWGFRYRSATTPTLPRWASSASERGEKSGT